MRCILAVLFACVALATSAWATGVTQTLKFKVLVSSFAGYKATPTAGWMQFYIMKVATTDANTKSTTDPKFIGLIGEKPDWNVAQDNPTVPPDTPYVTIFGPNGTVLQSEALPTGLTVSKGDCVNARYDYTTQQYINDGCPWMYYTVFTRKSNASRVVVRGESYASSYVNGVYVDHQRTANYVLDLSAAVGTSDRWTLLPAVTYNEDFNPDETSDLFPGADIDLTRGWLLSFDPAAKSIAVYSIVNK